MTIYVTTKKQLTPPAWDKSGEKRVLMSKAEQRRTFGTGTDPTKYLSREEPAGTKTRTGGVAAPKRRTAPPAVEPEVMKAIAKRFAAILKKEGTCGALRIIGKEFPDVHPKSVAFALPEVNASTINIQVRKGRKS
jgi:hypothetical protein